MMKIVCVQPHGTGVPHMGLLYLIGALKASGHNDINFVSIMSAINAPYKRSIDYFLDLMKNHPDIVIVSSMTPEFPEAKIICKLAKNSGAKVILGGCHSSIFKQELLVEYPFIDVVCSGEAENTISEIVDRLHNNKSLDRIKGIAYRKHDAAIKVNEPNPHIQDLDALPYPDRDCLDFDSYHTIFTILTSRGCPYGCTYCFKPVHGSVFRSRSPKNVVDEIEYLLNKYPYVKDKTISFVDDIFNFDINRAKQICDEIIKRKLDVSIMCVNGLHVRTVDYELMSKLKQVGCKEVWLGIESGNPEILKNIHKGINLSMVRDAVRIAKSVKIPTIAGHFIIGHQNETKETALETLRFAKSLYLDIVGINHANILPGSKLNDWAKEHGKLLYPENQYDIFVSKGYPVFETPEFTKEERIEVYNEFMRYSDSLWRKKAFSMRSVCNYLKKVKSISDVKKGMEKGLFLLLNKDLNVK